MKQLRPLLERILPNESVTTLVEYGERDCKLIQVRQSRHGAELLCLKQVPLNGSSEDLKNAVDSLPMPLKEVLLALPKSQVLTRIVSVPAQGPEELSAMVRYQLAGDIPYPIDECSIAIQVVNRREGKTKVLAVIVPRAVLDRLLTAVRSAGLHPSAVTLTSEGFVQWHQKLAPASGEEPGLIVEMSDEALEMAFVQGSVLMDLRSVPLVGLREGISPQWVLTQIQETIQSYTQKKIGEPIQWVSLGGFLNGTDGLVATLQEHLGIRVTLTDMHHLPFRESLAAYAEELTRNSFGGLLGLALQPQIRFNLLPAEVQQRRAAEECLLRAGCLAGWLGVCCWLAGALTALYIHSQELTNGHLKQELGKIQSAAQQTQEMAQHIAFVQKRRAETVHLLSRLNQFHSTIPSGIHVEVIDWDSKQIVLSGSTDNFSTLTGWIQELTQQKIFQSLSISRVNSSQTGLLHFDLEGAAS